MMSNLHAQQLTEQKWDVIIVGAGLAGLTAAIFLAEEGRRVLVLEQNNYLGGRASTLRKKGAYFNLGPHAIYEKGVGYKILTELGVSPQGSYPNTKNGKFMYKGQLYKLPTSLTSLLKNDFLSWKEKKEFIRVQMKLQMMNIEALADQSLASWVEQNMKSEKVREIFYLFCRLTTFVHAPQGFSCKLALQQLKNALGGVLYLDQGWQSLIDQLAAKAEAVGVVIARHVRIEEIQGSYPAIQVKLADQLMLSTSALISSTSAQVLQRLLKDNCPQLSSWSKASIPFKGASLDLLLKKLPNPTLDYVLNMDQALYCSSHSHAATLTDNPEHQLMHVYKYIPPLALNKIGTGQEMEADSVSNQVDSSAILQELQDFLELLQPDWQKYVVTSRFLPHVTVGHRLQQVGQEQLFKNHATSMKGIFVAGEWTETGAVLADAALLSAQKVAGETLELFKKR